MFNYDDEIKPLLLDPLDESKGFIQVKGFNYAELAEATSGAADKTVVGMIASNIVGAEGFSIRGKEPVIEEFMSWPAPLVEVIIKRYFDVFGSKNDPEVDPKVKEAKKK